MKYKKVGLKGKLYQYRSTKRKQEKSQNSLTIQPNELENEEQTSKLVEGQ